MPQIAEITVRRNAKEQSWEVVVDLGKYGRLFHYKVDAEEYAKLLQSPVFLQGEIGTGLRKL